MTYWHEKESGLKAFEEALGPKGSTRDPDIIAPHLREWRDKYQGASPIMLLPRTTEEVQTIVNLAMQHDIALTPQGGNTGLVGGGLPGLDDRPTALLSFKRMTDISVQGDTLVAGAGATIEAVAQVASDHERLFPLSLASQGSCTVGGTIATNAGGIHVVRYGVMRHLTTGVKAVLADGSIIDETADLTKDNSGYRLTPLLTGSEGTLGLITEARLKLFPQEHRHITGWIDLHGFNDAASLLADLKDLSGGRLSVFEIMSGFSLKLAATHMPKSAQTLKSIGYAAAPWSVLFEIGLSTQEPELTDRLLEYLTNNPLVNSAALAQGEDQRRAMIAVREGLSEAQKYEGISIKHDISLPVLAMPDFMRDAEVFAQTMIPGIRPVVFGHLGDGNLHYNLMKPESSDSWKLEEQWQDIQAGVHTLVHKYGGSLSAEHGIGRMKKQDLQRLAPERYSAMKKIKNAMDPQKILNPGVLF